MLCGAAQASTLDFSDTFTHPDGTDLNGTNGWSVSGTGTVTAQDGSAQIVNSDTNDVTFSNTFDDEERAVSISFDLQPVYTDGTPGGSFPADSTFVFFVDTNGMINVYDGQSPIALVHDAVSDQVMTTNVQVYVDYGLSKWAISLGSVELASNLTFYSDSHTNFSELAFREAGLSATSVVDNVDINAEVAGIPSTTTTTVAPTTTTTTVAPTTTTTTTGVASRMLPFEEPFDSLVLGDLDTQREWVSTHAIVQNSVTRGGKACSITNQLGRIEHTFDGDPTNVWTQLDIRPVRGTPSQPPAGTTFAYYVNTNGVVMAYDGGTATNLPATVPVDTWVRFQTLTDYANTNWNLYLNSRLIGEDLDFFSDDRDHDMEIGIYGVTSGVTYVDNIYVGETRPASPACVLIVR
jgi:hypothetical protein